LFIDVESFSCARKHNAYVCLKKVFTPYKVQIPPGPLILGIHKGARVKAYIEGVFRANHERW